MSKRSKSSARKRRARWLMRTPCSPASSMARRSGPSPSCQPLVPALSTRTRSPSPASSARWAMTAAAVGERQMLPRQTKQIRTGGEPKRRRYQRASRSGQAASGGHPVGCELHPDLGAGAVLADDDALGEAVHQGAAAPAIGGGRRGLGGCRPGAGIRAAPVPDTDGGPLPADHEADRHLATGGGAVLEGVGQGLGDRHEHGRARAVAPVLALERAGEGLASPGQPSCLSREASPARYALLVLVAACRCAVSHPSIPPQERAATYAGAPRPICTPLNARSGPSLSGRASRPPGARGW